MLILFRTLVKVAVASLVVGTIMAHFGITAEQLMREVGLSTERIRNTQGKASRGLAKCAPGFDSNHTYMVRGFFISPAAQEHVATLNSDLSAQGRTFAPYRPRLAISDAATVPTATIAIMIVHTALISGFTPRRTSE